MSKAFQNRAFAYLYAVMTYRNDTPLENRHTSLQPLDEEFYDTMLPVVAELFRDRYRVITDNAAGVLPSDDETLRVLEYIHLYLPTMNQWDPPQKVRDRYTGDIASFVLSGRFKQACEAHEVPTDDLMKEMNHDVHCRYYTLLCRGII